MNLKPFRAFLTRAICASLAGAAALSASALIIVPRTLVDPINGDRVECVGIASFSGGRDEEGYDVIAAHVLRASICANPDSGFAAFGTDFANLPPAEKAAIASWLAVNYRPPPRRLDKTDPAWCEAYWAGLGEGRSPNATDEREGGRGRAPSLARWQLADGCDFTRIESLPWIEQLYRLRKMPEEFWLTFYRLAAYEYRNDPVDGPRYVRKALPLVERLLAQSSDRGERLTGLYLLGEYHRRLGHFDKARWYFRRVWNTNVFDRDGNVIVALDAFRTMALERQQLLPPPAGSRREPRAAGSR
jgi:hypothetical protein